MLGEKGRITLRRLGLAALDTLFPPRCFGCGRYGSFLCSSCDVSAPRLEQPFCRICAQPGATVGVCIECAHRPPPVEGIRVPYLMQGTIREGVHSLKYRNVRAAAPTLAGLLRPKPGAGASGRRPGAGALASETPPQTGVQSVGAAGPRGRQADRLAGRGKCPGQDQGHSSPGRLSYAERVRNVAGSFACAGDVEGRSFILVDDVVHGQHHVRLCRSPEGRGSRVGLGSGAGPGGGRLLRGYGSKNLL